MRVTPRFGEALDFDVRHGSIKRVTSAVGEGATSIALVHSYLATLDKNQQ